MTKDELKAKLVELEIDFPEDAKKADLEALLPEGENEEVNFPEVSASGKFQAVKFDKGYVVYNPVGQRVSGVLELSQANDIVRAQNQAAHIKIR